ncbi:hypothetical protein [Rufibacter ruber]|uniref:hypothetical protein n=1 Tax=Rufibacter ruber TaxID=1783499 RepID=UPI00083076F6|nr:hypothetical protein [Rufibacter ruber]
MKNTISVIVAAAFFCLVGCSEKKKQTEGFTPQPMNFPSAAAATDSTGAQPAAGAVAVNPPHGQPGHRCDLQVGAPLPSTPQPSPAVTTSAPAPATQVVTPTPAPAPVTTAPGMNPPHGQPGHRCDIQVGAPLK